MKNVKFISCRETPEGYLLRETSTGVVLEKYHTTKKDGTSSWQVKEFLNKVIWRDLNEVIDLTRKLVGNDCDLYVDNDSLYVYLLDLEKDDKVIHLEQCITANSVLAGAGSSAPAFFHVCFLSIKLFSFFGSLLV